MVNAHLLPYSAAVRDLATQRALRQLEDLLASTVTAVNNQASSSGGVPTTRAINTTAPLAGGGTLATDLTLSVATFTSGASGVVPASGGGTTNFLRADGTWAAPGGSGVTSVSAGSTAVSVVPTTGAVVVDVVEANFTGIPESAVTNLVTDLAGKVPTSRLINTTLPLTGGGNLSADLTLAVNTVTSGASGVAPASGGGKLNFLRADITWAKPLAPMTGDMIWSDGQDGSLHFDGVSTVTIGQGQTIVPSGGIYTLARSLYPTDMTVDSGVIIKTAGYMIIGTGTLTNNGTIQDAGNNGGNASGITAGTAGAARSAGYYNATSAGAAGGGSGGTGGASGAVLSPPWGITAAGVSGGAAPGITTAGNPGSSGVKSFAGAGGGSGGGGSSAGGGTGGTGGSLTQVTANLGPLMEMLVFGHSGSALTGFMTYGSGGGGGGGGGAGASGGQAGSGGGGGAGGGILFVSYPTIAGSGLFSANGGNGGNGADAQIVGTLSGGYGGGGTGAGGGGGLALVRYWTSTGTWTVTANGGAPGQTVGSGVGTGKAGALGGTGANGYAWKVNMSGDGT